MQFFQFVFVLQREYLAGTETILMEEEKEINMQIDVARNAGQPDDVIDVLNMKKLAIVAISPVIGDIMNQKDWKNQTMMLDESKVLKIIFQDQVIC